jgi:acetyl esterase/lipase
LQATTFFASIGLAASLCAQSPGRKLTTVQRLQPEHLQAVHEARLRLAQQRKEIPSREVFQDYRVILHVHAEDAPHTGGTRAQVLAGAQQAGVAAILFSDHNGPKADTWRGLRDGVLFVPGAERSAEHLLEVDFRDGPLRFLSHVEEVIDAPAAGFAGMEIYNRHTDAKDEAEFDRYFKAAEANPAEWKKIAAAVAAFPDEVFAAQQDYWPAIFAKWDRENRSHHLTGIAANDAHHNVVRQGVDFDPYERSFRYVSTHLLARALTEANLRDALAAGRAYVAHDWLADATGFSFQASNNLGVFDMGDTVPLAGSTRITAQTAVPARLKLLRDGEMVAEASSASLNFAVKEPGAYRLEAWLDIDGEQRPWIYANPIYVAAPGPETLRLPSTEISPAVEVVKNIAYTAGEPADEEKHKLDLYLPKGKTNFSVLFFIHGGAWRSGDRSRYPALGNRFAMAGIGTVVPSYRLAPQNPHPAQIDDVAAAFAWTLANIQGYGGRRDRIFVAGHSAGGHLAALLALDPRYHTGKDIRGVIAMSGVYRIEGLDSVFGSDPQEKRRASPITYVSADAPQFLVTYCQWDYLTLPAQARLFDAALRRAGAKSELLYVPGQSHISEIVNVVREDDITADAILRFIKP